jgi:hypothetical protein
VGPYSKCNLTRIIFIDRAWNSPNNQLQSTSKYQMIPAFEWSISPGIRHSNTRPFANPKCVLWSIWFSNCALG